MPEQFLHLPVSERRKILENVVAEASLEQQVIMLEKDVWICWILQVLFSMPDAHPMAFKGGTSLSKIYGAINRFSEDVDVSIDYRAFGEDFDPFATDVSKNAIRLFSDRLKGYVCQYVNDVIVPYINTRLEAMPRPEEYEIEISEDGEKIWVNYPSAFKSESGDAYLESSVLIELGGRNVIDPNERHTVTPYILESVTDLDLPSGKVTVLSPERTFWEKVTLIHVECNRKRLRENMNSLSRHWYDLQMLATHDVGRAAINNRALLEEVIRHKNVFFNYSYANYEACLSNEVRLVPNEDVIAKLRTDYEKMLETGMIYGEPLPFDVIIAGIREIEREVNA